MKPEFPYISMYKNGLSLITKDNCWTSASYLSIKEEEKGIVFDKTGSCWNHIFIPLKQDWKYKYLSPLFNLSSDIEIEWTNKRAYTLKELKSKIIQCLEKDTDILTQFYEKETLKNIVNDSKSFEEIILIFHKPNY